MEIEKFIKTTLDEIEKGIKSDSPESEQKHFYLDSGGVDFDLAVSVLKQNQQKTKGSAKAGIKVVEMNGDFDNSKTRKNEYISRVRFTVRYGSDGKAGVIKSVGTLSKIY